MSFQSVDDAQGLARRRLPSSVYGALLAGSERGVTYRDNTSAFAELGLVPRSVVASVSGTPELATTILGQHISLPVFLTPTGVQAVHPDGEVAVARAAAAAGTALGLSSFASKPMEDVAAANPLTFFQLCWAGSRDDLLALVARARAAGVAGFILTLDWSFAQGRDWGSPVIPERIDVPTALRFAPELLLRPRWLARFLASGRIPDLTAPNLAADGSAPTFFEAYREWMATPPPTWADIAWLRQQWDGPFMIKGIIRVDDAKRAVDVGATAISVSSHGGNNLDGTPAPIRTLGPIANAVGDQVEVVMDGGIRYGSDVVKALALGARAVMIGRPYLWGLAVAGQPGVERVLDLLRAGIEQTLAGLGRASIADLSPADLIVPPGFARAL